MGDDHEIHLGVRKERMPALLRGLSRRTRTALDPRMPSREIRPPLIVRFGDGVEVATHMELWRRYSDRLVPPPAAIDWDWNDPPRLTFSLSVRGDEVLSRVLPDDPGRWWFEDVEMYQLGTVYMSAGAVDPASEWVMWELVPPGSGMSAAFRDSPSVHRAFIDVLDNADPAGFGLIENYVEPTLWLRFAPLYVATHLDELTALHPYDANSPNGSYEFMSWAERFLPTVVPELLIE